MIRFFSLLILLFYATGIYSQETETVFASYKYIMGDNDTKNDANYQVTFLIGSGTTSSYGDTKVSSIMGESGAGSITGNYMVEIWGDPMTGQNFNYFQPVVRATTSLASLTTVLQPDSSMHMRLHNFVELHFQ